MTSNDTHHEVKYLNTSRDNFKNWKRSIDAKLGKHPDRLLPVVQDQELAVATKTKVLLKATRIRDQRDPAAAGRDPPGV